MYFRGHSELCQSVSVFCYGTSEEGILCLADAYVVRLLLVVVSRSKLGDAIA